MDIHESAQNTKLTQTEQTPQKNSDLIRKIV